VTDLTLAEMREYIDDLASDDGPYYVACGRTGHRPVPVAGKRFDERPTARSVARVAERYRAALRRYDPQVANYDLIVRQDAPPVVPGETDAEEPEHRSWTLSEPVLGGVSPAPERTDLAAFCDRVASAALELLPGGGPNATPTVLDAHPGIPGGVADREDRAVGLLEHVATEVDARLDPSEQAEVVTGVATRLGPVAGSDRPLGATLARLERRGLIGSYTQQVRAVDRGVVQSIDVELSGYALSPRDGRLPVLPIAVGLFRHRSDPDPVTLRAVDVDAEGERNGGGGRDWHVEVDLAGGAGPTGVACAPIRGGV
jgi:hypothetical protein